MLPDSILPTPEDDIARVLRDYERRLSSLERLEDSLGWSLFESSLPGGASSVDFLNIPSSFKHLAIICYLRNTRAATTNNLFMRFNGDFGANYDYLRTTGTHPNAFTTSEGIAATFIFIATYASGNAPANAFDMAVIYIANYANTTGQKAARSNNTRKAANVTGSVSLDQFEGWWRSTAAINRVTFLDASGTNFAAGTQFDLYGIK